MLPRATIRPRRASRRTSGEPPSAAYPAHRYRPFVRGGAYVAGMRLSNRHSTMTCSDWQAEYSAALVPIGGSPDSRTHGTGTKANLDQVRREACPISFTPGG